MISRPSFFSGVRATFSEAGSRAEPEPARVEYGRFMCRASSQSGQGRATLADRDALCRRSMQLDGAADASPCCVDLRSCPEAFPPFLFSFERLFDFIVKGAL